MSYKGYKHSPEAKAKMSKSRMGKKLSEGTKQRISSKNKGRKIIGVALDNLRKGIQENRYNQDYALKLSVTKQGEINPQAVLSDQIVLDIRKEYIEALNVGFKKTETQYYLSDKYGVKRPTISDVVLNKTWKHLL